MSLVRKFLIVIIMLALFSLSGCSSAQVNDLLQLVVTAAISLQQVVMGTATATVPAPIATVSPILNLETPTPRNILPATWTPVAIAPSGQPAGMTPTRLVTSTVQGTGIISYTLEPSATAILPLTPAPGTTPRATKTEIVSESGCTYKAKFEHGDIPSWACYPVGKEFSTKFRIRNVGTCTWTRDFWFKFVKGDQLSKESMVPLTIWDNIPPGGTVEVRVWLKMPKQPDYYSSYWMILGDGKVFGWFWVNVSTYKKGITKCLPTPKP